MYLPSTDLIYKSQLGKTRNGQKGQAGLTGLGQDFVGAIVVGIVREQV